MSIAMIDFMKVVLDRDTAKQLETNRMLDFIGRYSRTHGDVKDFRRIATYQNLSFDIRSENYCTVSGSLHKFAHGGVNHTDLPFAGVMDAILQLQEQFGIDPERARLSNLEIGVNLTNLPISPNDFLRLVLSHKSEPFGRMKKYKGKSIGVDCDHQRYRIKIYDKGQQCSLPNPVLRFEIQYKKMHDLNKLGVTTLSDLTNNSVITVMSHQIARRFDDILLIEPSLQARGLKSSERRKLADYENPKYWERLKTDSSKNHDYHRQQYRTLIERYVDHPLHQQVSDMLKNKVTQLLPVDRETLAKLTNLQNSNLSQSNPLYKGLPAFGNQHPKFAKVGGIQRETVELSNSNSQPGRRCKTTGVDISDQRAGSKFVSAKKVGYQEAHRARNLDSNERNNLRYKIKKLEGEHVNALFPLEDVLRLSDEQQRVLSHYQGTKHEVQLAG